MLHNSSSSTSLREHVVRHKIAHGCFHSFSDLGIQLHLRQCCQHLSSMHTQHLYPVNLHSSAVQLEARLLCVHMM